MSNFSKELSKYIKLNKLAKETLNDFFIRVVAKKPNGFIAIMLKDLRSSAYNMKLIFDTFKTEDAAWDWYYFKKGYLHQYTSYMCNKLGKAKKPEDIIKFLPNVAPWAYAEHFKGFDIGSIPDSFVNKKVLDILIKKILNSKVVKKFKVIKDEEAHESVFHKSHFLYDKYNLLAFFSKKMALEEKIKQKIGKPLIFNIKGYKYQIIPACNPYSAKMVFRIKSLSDNKDYILKISENNNPCIKTDKDRKIKENQMLRGDSPYINAMVDFYLKLNGCKHATSISYYNYKHDFVIYDMEEGVETTFTEEVTFNLDRFNREHCLDANLLGIYLNDVNNGNLFKVNEHPNVKIIDTGHVSYANIANPGIIGSTTNISNLCGRNFISSLGSLNITKK